MLHSVARISSCHHWRSSFERQLWVILNKIVTRAKKDPNIEDIVVSLHKNHEFAHIIFFGIDVASSVSIHQYILSHGSLHSHLWLWVKSEKNRCWGEKNKYVSKPTIFIAANMENVRFTTKKMAFKLHFVYVCVSHTRKKKNNLMVIQMSPMKQDTVWKQCLRYIYSSNDFFLYLLLAWMWRSLGYLHIWINLTISFSHSERKKWILATFLLTKVCLHSDECQLLTWFCMGNI